MYNYREAIKSDVLDHVRNEYTPDEIREKLEDREEWESELNDELWIADSVTGNASGSYTFSSWTAENYVSDNLDELRRACEDFGIDAATIGEKFLDDEWEYFDVTIRCYLLGSAISEVLDELEEDAKQ